MRFIFVLFAVMLTAAGVLATEPKVESFAVSSFDLSARTNERVDLNGVPCALVKLQLPVDGCKFEGNIVDTKFDVNEYWIYMTKGSRRLDIKCPGATKLSVIFADVSDIPALESNVTYVLTVTGYDIAVSGSTNPSATAIVGSMAVDFKPNGANIDLDGKNLGVTPSLLNDVAVGKHKVTIRYKGYEAAELDVEVHRDETVRLQGELEKIPGHTEAREFDLCATVDGHDVFFTSSEWKALSPEKQSKYSKKGVVMRDRTGLFVVSLDISNDEMTWRDAFKRYGDGQLPTYDQCMAMSNQCKALNNAILNFGGNVPTSKNSVWGTSFNTSSAWCVNMQHGYVNSRPKTGELYRVRSVTPL